MFIILLSLMRCMFFAELAMVMFVKQGYAKGNLDEIGTLRWKCRKMMFVNLVYVLETFAVLLAN